ncbi:MAG TPA: NAD(P)/FAD-dependent oxidoreductase [Sphingobium sp.]|uniref:flavin-containing monooxygenase n=1 Tax=Sphingobium sp. TaxID=1912891 RepID=UPI002ED14877
MSCQPTNTPPASSFDIPSLRKKYAYERDKRLGQEATDHDVRTEGGDFADVYEGDPRMPVTLRDPISEDIDVAILGAGWAGLLAAYHLKKQGVTTFRNIDHAGSWGGVWYWNRYPGLQCDNDAYCYLPLLEETGFMPSKKFVDGFEINDYMHLIVEKFGLGENALFHTLTKALHWDEEIQRWRIETDRGDDIRARFVIMANGLLNIPKFPGIPGIETYKGKMFHTSRWDYGYTGGERRSPILDKLADKHVAIVGTGATAVQATPFLGKYARQLYVVQRTPSTIDQRDNPITDPEWAKSLQPGWQAERRRNFHHAAVERLAPGEPDQICDIWTEISRNLSAELAAEGYPDISIEEYFRRREVVDYQVMERLRARVESLVEDKETAEALKPWYRFLCKRPASNNEFYSTFNRPNVKLVDVSLTRGVERMTEKGFVAQGVEYEVDCMIFASGFEVTSDLDRRWGLEAIEGRNGLSLYDYWRDDYKTLHGMTARNFPNLFFTGFIQSAFNATITELMGRHCHHVAYIIKQAQERGIEAVEPSQDAQDAWVEHVRATHVDTSDFVRECTPSYFFGEGSEKPRSYLGDTYGPGWDAFERVLEDWRGEGALEGLVLTKATDSEVTA